MTRYLMSGVLTKVRREKQRILDEEAKAAGESRKMATIGRLECLKVMN